jgi:hypothetical protein
LNGWAIVYPRSIHSVAFSTVSGTAAGTEGASFANFTPVPSGAAPVPAHGVLLTVTSSWNHISGRGRLGHDSRFPLHLPAAFEMHATGSMQSVDLQFQGNGVAYDASVVAGPAASSTDLDALERMVASISFPPAGGAPASASQPRLG